MTKNAIKNCPCCGSEGSKFSAMVGGDGYMTQVRCQKCGMASGYYTDEKDAVKVWNVRWTNSAIFEHYKDGDQYKFITEGFTESDGEHVIVYESCSTGNVWVRPKKEFDKKFKKITHFLN